jgi:Putative adhesin
MPVAKTALPSLLACLSMLSLVLASGCISGPTASVASSDPGSAESPQGSMAGSPGSHGSPQRDEGAVSTQTEGGQVVARRTVTIDNDFGGASRSAILATTFNGGVVLEVSSDGGYHLTAELQGRGATPDEAREALDAVRLDNSDDLRGDTLELSFIITSGPLGSNGFPFPIGPATSRSNGGSLHLAVPSEPAHDLEAGTSNGGIDVLGLHGPHVKAGSSNGGIHLEGAFEKAEVGTSNGAIELLGILNGIDGQTSNGRITAAFRSTESGQVSLSTSNGRIEVEVPHDDTAYDITASTSNGDITMDVEGHKSERDDHDSFRSDDWTTANVRIRMDLSTSNGEIDVRD